MRRAGYKNELRQAFRRFFIRKKVDEEYMERKARQAGLGWNLSVAVLLERQCIVMPDMEDWEIDMENLQAHLGKYGKMYPKELLNMDEEVDVDDIAITNEELLALLPEGFVPAPRETPADASGDVRTTERKLKTSVYLAVQSGEDDSSSSNNNNNNKDLWQFPTVAVQEDETLLEAAKRALATQIGPEVEYWTPSNCPCAVDMVALPEEDRAAQGVYGTKTFFMKVTYSDGQVDPSTMKVKDYAWLDRGEVTERVKDQQGDNAASFYHYLL
jgi:large subunit ribosomal protein L46